MNLEKTWIVVADGSQARFLEYHQRTGLLKPVDGMTFQHSRTPSHELGTDRQPRVFESVGSARHGVEPRIDLHDQQELQFLQSIAETLAVCEKEERFEKLILIAPATALGQLRKTLSPAMKKKITGEMSHDYCNQTNDYVLKRVIEKFPLNIEARTGGRART
jgi:protein required for attachment to host cells